MTVRSEMVNQGRRSGVDLKVHTAVEVESGGSSTDEIESLKSVSKIGLQRSLNRKIGNVHSQVLRIREEDLWLGKDIGEGLSGKEKISSCGGGVDQFVAAPAMHVVLFSRPILPCSPLSGKSTVRAIK